MKRIGLLLAAIALAAPLAAAAWEEVGKTFGQEGKALPGDVQKYSWPRSDLSVRVATVRVEPALALGSWAAFHSDGTKAMTMGDLVLLESEVNPVIRELESGGFEVLAVHNHLLGESPHVLYVHFMGKGEPAALAKTLNDALAKTKTPKTAGTPAHPTSAQTKVLDELQSSLGRKGTMAGTVLQIGVPRAEPITDGGMEIPSSMGMAESINAQAAGERVAATGDFVLVADEVNPVIRELQSHGIEITALHSHMLRETPRLFFMHFWGVGTPERIGEGLKGALAKIATKP
ncbi:MAG TPA: DUF1259 domain-containing protein [Thermoanaerobaculia bacterium]|nr:DUF1259 domain-containing protein [Thermoanaerobaculia bacterium]